MTREELKTLLTQWEQFKKERWWNSDAIDVEAFLMDEFSLSATYYFPPAEGAEEIFNRYCTVENRALYMYIIDNKKGFINAMDEHTALHAQKIADKMVSERLREELIAYDTWCFPIETYKNKIPSPSDSVDKYLKTRASHE